MTIREKLDLFLPSVVKEMYIKNLETLNPSGDYADWFLDNSSTSFTGGFTFDKSPEGHTFWCEASDLFKKFETLYNNK